MNPDRLFPQPVFLYAFLDVQICTSIFVFLGVNVQIRRKSQLRGLPVRIYK